MKRFTSILKQVIFPSKCLICGSFFQSRQDTGSFLSKKSFQDKSLTTFNKSADFEFLMASFLCPSCMAGFLSVESPLCTKCGVMFKSRAGKDHFCGKCLKHPKKFRKARAAGVYNQTFRDVIHSFKYKEKTELSRPLGMLLLYAFIKFWDKESIDTVVPVPLHIKRFKERGFNQAFLLVKNWHRIASAFSIDLTYLKIDKNILIKKKWTKPQTGLGREKRLTNMKNAFSLNHSSHLLEVKGKNFLIVDDVYTTGATVSECAEVLLQSGAKDVDVLTLSRVSHDFS